MFIKITDPYARFKLFFADLTDEKRKDRMALRALCHVMSSNLYGEKMKGVISEITQIHPNVRNFLTDELLLRLFKKLCRDKIRIRAHLTNSEYESFLLELQKQTPTLIKKLEIEALKVFAFSNHDIRGNNLSYSDFAHLQLKDTIMISRLYFKSPKINAFLKMKLAEELGLEMKRFSFAKKYAIYLLRRAKSMGNPRSYFDDFRRLQLPRGIKRSILLKTITANCNPAGIDFAIRLAELLDGTVRQKAKEELQRIREIF